MKLEGLAVFAAVAEAGSISEAARRLGLPKSVVSERLADLERELGARLIQRTTRKMSLTEDGSAFLFRARRILQEAQDGRDELAERRGELIGPLRLSAPVSFGCLHLAPALITFLKQHPKIVPSLELDDRFVDIAAGYDAVIRHGPIGDSRLVAHRLAPSRRVLVASPAYLAEHGDPKSLAALAGHRAILYGYRETDWRFQSPAGTRVVRPTVSLRINNGMVIREAALAGLGIALVPAFIVPDELRTGALRALDVGFEPEGAQLFIAYPRDRTAVVKIQALTRHLRQTFGDPPYWEKPLR
ncbi:MAG TPA: LysR family transcriptional regulator [Rhodopila sp.]|nr:LysR family transcriptional regulator [Rhodopila sp.]